MKPLRTGDCRVAIDARYLQRRGVGISRYLHHLVCELLDAGAEVTLLSDRLDHVAELREAFPAADCAAIGGRSGFLWEQIALRRQLAAARYDVYIAPSNYGVPFGYRGRTQLILIVHDLIPLRLPHLYLLPRPLWAAKYLLSLGLAVLRADHVVAVSEATARDVTRLLRKPDVAVVYPAVPQLGVQPGSSQQRTGRSDAVAGDRETPGAGGGRQPPYFVYNGGADIRKNVPLLLHAFSQSHRQLGDAQLVLLGPGYERFRPLLTRLGIEGHVRMPGYVSEATKDGILRGALALVYPSRTEGFGLPVVEALAAGIPVICGTGGALRETGGDAAIYVQPLNVRSLAAAMVAVTDAGVRDQARQAGTIQLTLLRQRAAATTIAGLVTAYAGWLPDGQHAAI